ncbi:MAG: hypothetical protein ABI588_09285, partial [Arenimonas sp.]
MTRSAGKFLGSLLGQLVVVLLVLLLALLGLYFAFESNEHAGHARMMVLSNDAVRSLARDELLSRGQRLATQFAGSVAQPILEADPARVADVARATLQQPDVQYVMVFDRDGRIVDAGDDTGQVGRPMVDPLADLALQAGSLKWQWTDNLLDVTMPVRSAGARIGGVRVGLVADGTGAGQARILEPITRHLEGAARAQHRWALGMLLLVAVLGAAIVVLLEWRVLGPIRRLGSIMGADRPGQVAAPTRDAER